MPVDAGYLVTNECMAITSAMRKSSRQVNSGIAAILGTQNDDGDESLGDRLGLRTAQRGHALAIDNPLILGFAKLRAELDTLSNEDDGGDLAELPAPALVRPFLAVIKAPTTTGAITSLALAALEKMIVLQILSPATPDIGLGLHEAAMAITHCRFEATDQNEDDAVLVQLMGVLDKIVAGPLAPLLSNEAICEVVETCLSMACQMRRGDALRRSVVSTVMGLMRMVFRRLPEEPEPVPEQAIDLVIEEPDTPSPEAQGTAGLEQADTAVAEASPAHSDSPASHSPASHSPTSDSANSPTGVTVGASATPRAAKSTTPFSTPAILETFRVLVSIANPQSQHAYSDSTRVMVLRVLRVCFEVGGYAMARHPQFVELTSAHLWKYLAQLVRREHPALVYESLQLVSLIMKTGGEHYKLQFEFVLVYLLSSLTPLTDLPRDSTIDGMFYDGVVSRPACVKAPAAGAPATSRAPEIREIMVEALTRMAHAPSFFSALFANYDCDVAQTDLCQDLVGFLCRSAYPDSATWSTPAVPPLCLEAVLSLLQRLTARLGPLNSSPSAPFAGESLAPRGPPLAGELGKAGQSIDSPAAGGPGGVGGTPTKTPPGSDDAAAAAAAAARDRKRAEVQVAASFNESAKTGLKLAVELGVIADASPAEVARFVRSSRRLDKGALGNFLAKPANKDVLAEYMTSFDFGGKRIDEALREFLCCFRLPGESAQIELIFEKFSDRYVAGAGNTQYVANSDGAFILAYAVAMLNTDQHSPKVKRRMEFESFARNLRGGNGGKDFDDGFLRQVYEAIKSREMILPEEHDTDETFEYSWRELLLQLEQASRYVPHAPAAIDKYLFTAVWLPIVSTLSFVFATATDDVVFSRVIQGFRQVAGLAAAYDADGALDHIVECLSKISTLASGDLDSPNSNLCVDIKDDQTHYKVVVSDLSVPFGSDLKAQMASITLFRILGDGAGAALGPRGWACVGKALANLYIYDLYVPEGLRSIPPAYTFERSKSGKSVGIFSALSSYLTANPDTPAEPSDEDVDAALGAQDCVRACDIAGVLRAVLAQPNPQLVDGFLAVLPAAGDSPAPGPSSAGKADARAAAAGGAARERGVAPARRLLLDVALKAASPRDAGHVAAAAAPDGGTVGVRAALASGDEALISAALKKTAVGEILLLDVPAVPALWTRLALAKDAQGAGKYAAARAGGLSADALEPAEQALASLAAGGSGEALEALYALSGARRTQEHFLKYVGELVTPCTAPPALAVREAALSRLSGLLLTADATAQAGSWQALFAASVLPLIEELLRPEVFKRDEKGMEMTRQQATSLAGKMFLQNALQNDADIEEPWTKLLRALDRLLSSRRQPALHESIVEMLKNVVLVMRMGHKGSAEFWAASEKQLKGFVPQVAALLRDGSAPAEAGPPSAGSAASASETEASQTEGLTPSTTSTAPTATTHDDKLRDPETPRDSPSPVSKS